MELMETGQENFPGLSEQNTAGVFLGQHNFWPTWFLTIQEVRKGGFLPSGFTQNIFFILN